MLADLWSNLVRRLHASGNWSISEERPYGMLCRGRRLRVNAGHPLSTASSKARQNTRHNSCASEVLGDLLFCWIAECFLSRPCANSVPYLPLHFFLKRSKNSPAGNCPLARLLLIPSCSCLGRRPSFSFKHSTLLHSPRPFHPVQAVAPSRSSRQRGIRRACGPGAVGDWLLPHRQSNASICLRGSHIAA